MLEVREVKHHQTSHAHSLDQVDYDKCELKEEARPFMLLAVVKVFQVEPSKVRECKKGRYDGICAPLLLQGVPNVPLVFPLSFDSSLRLYKQPDDQGDHYKDLDKEAVAEYLIHQAGVLIKGNSFVPLLVR